MIDQFIKKYFPQLDVWNGDLSLVLEWPIFSLEIFSSAGCLERWSATCTTQLMSTRPRWVLSVENWKYIFSQSFEEWNQICRAYSRAWVDLESHFCQSPTLSLSHVMGPKCPKKLFRPTGRLLARIYISTIKAGESCLRVILGEHSSLVLYQPGPLLRNCQAVWLPLLHEHQVVVHLFKALLWWKITFKHTLLLDPSLIIALPCQ